MSTIRKSNRRPGVGDTAKIRQLFNAYDTNHDGGISFQELCNMLEKMSIRMNADDQKKFFDMIDVDKSGTIEFGEFLDWYTTLMDLVEESAQKTLSSLQKTTTFSRSELETIYENYKRVSASVVDDGAIDQEEFKQMMIAGGVASWNSFLVDGLFRLFDADNSGTITFEEFVRILSILHNKTNNSQEDKHKLLFQLYDIDKDGKISMSDMCKILNDCLCSNNMELNEGDVMKVVKSTFVRNGCGEFMSVEDYLREMKARGL
jgi:Ca2+-binding EF-hand superfamily protein